MEPPFPPDPATRERLRAIAERRLDSDEVAAMLAIPVTPEERQEVLDMARWFQRRYPTPAERLAWARRAHARWTRIVPGPPLER